MSKFYITTAIDYVNSSPHIGTAYEKIGADTLARFKRLCGLDTFFLMGNDEHSINVQRKAILLNKEPLAYCDMMEEEFKDVWRRLLLSFDNFIRTSSRSHHLAVKEIFQRILARGDIYKGFYKGWYCTSCEAYIKDADLLEGKCPIHQVKPQWLEEQNYFFALSRYRDQILKYITQNPDFILPPIRRNEILSMLESGLEDISISRATTKWGIPIPGDTSQVVYVWFDALINYLSGVGFPENPERFQRYWPCDLHVIGKDITRFHCIVWPAMLISAGIPLPRQIYAHGFVYVKGEKMSKTKGTAVDPSDIAERYGPDVLRYFLLREIAFDKDGDFSWEKFLQRYNADLANDLGNLLHRTINMVYIYLGGYVKQGTQSEPVDEDLKGHLCSLADRIEPMMNQLEFHNALSEIWGRINYLNTYLEKTSPWSLSKMGQTERIKVVLYNTLESLRILAILLGPFLPSSALKIWEQLGLAEIIDFNQNRLHMAKSWGVFPEGVCVKKGRPIFPRITGE
jgi:methionyl-tRNA synthetase